MRGKNINNRKFDLGLSNFIAPNSVIIGDVTLAKNSSVWFGAQLNADKGMIILGENSQIQDNVLVNPGHEMTVIGKNVTVNSNAMLKGCQIRDGAFIGANAYIGQGSVIEEGAFVAAGANVPCGVTVPANQVWAGSPAEYLRQVRPNERENILDQHQEYIDLAHIYCEHTEMSFRQLIDWMHDWEHKRNMNVEDMVAYRMEELGLPTMDQDLDYYDARHQHLSRYHQFSGQLSPWDENPDSFEYDNNSFPEALKMYKKNYESYEDSKKYFDEKPTEYPKFKSDKFEEPTLHKEPWTQKF